MVRSNTIWKGNGKNRIRGGNKIRFLTSFGPSMRLFWK